MLLRRRYLFPGIYFVLLLPILLQTGLAVKASLAVLLLALAITVNGRAVKPIVFLVLTSLATLTPFLLLVQAAVCSSSSQAGWRPLMECAGQNAIGVLLNIGLLSSVVVLGAANEWRGSLVASINRMALQRNVRMMAIVSGAMIGEFRRAVLKVHHAYTARGQAMPSVHWRNLIVLPGMLGVVWAAVLNSAAERLRGQWSANTFWERYVPARRPSSPKGTWTDLAVLGTALLIVAVLLAAKFL